MIPVTESIVELVERHGWHNPTSYDRSMGLYCHCGKYCPGGMQEWRKHVTRVVRGFDFMRRGEEGA